MIHPRINPRVSTPSTLNDETRDALAAGLALALAADAPNVIRLLQDFAADSVKAACPGPMGGASPASRLRDTGSRAASFGVSMMLAETYRSGSKHHLRAQARELQAELDRVHANLAADRAADIAAAEGLIEAHVAREAAAIIAAEVLTERTLTTYFAQPLADLERQLAELEAERDELRSRVAILEADLRDAAWEAP